MFLRDSKSNLKSCRQNLNVTLFGAFFFFLEVKLKLAFEFDLKVWLPRGDKIFPYVRVCDITDICVIA